MEYPKRVKGGDPIEKGRAERRGPVFFARRYLEKVKYEEKWRANFGEADGGGPIRVEVPAALPYADMVDYIRSWPDKLVSFVAARLCDDDLDAFAWELYAYICAADRDGPAFEKWRVS